MTASLETITGWVKQAHARGYRWLIVACDTYDHTNYPLELMDEEDFWQAYEKHSGPNMTQVDEVYDLSMDLDYQLKERRAMHLPPRVKGLTL